jgi:hypothetical protein
MVVSAGLINETASRRYFPDDDPIGRSIAFGSAESTAREIVGVVADIKDGPPETPPHPSAYVPFDLAGFSFVVRTSESGTAIFPLLGAAIREIRPDALLGDLATMAELTISVGQRTREIGVRMALGAQRASVYRLVVGQASWLIGMGTALGMICAVMAASFMRHLLFDVQFWDPPILLVAFVLATSALAASYIPARRAASVNPIEVLRAE